MSTAGSVHKRAFGPYGPSGTPAGGDAPPHRTGRPALFRWRGILPLALIFALVAAAWTIFGDRILRTTTEEAATKLLGTDVDIGAFDLRERIATVVLRDVQIADPFDPMRNLLAAEHLRLVLEPEPLLQKKLVISQLSLRGVRLGTARSTPATPTRGDGFAPRTLLELQRWAGQFDVPLLQLTPIDTIKSIVLDPTQLATVREALALRGRSDSVRSALEDGYRGLRLQETLDSTQALTRRLAGARPLSLGIDGTVRAIADVRRALARVDSARQRVVSLEQSTRGGLALLVTGVHELDATRRADYEFARGLLALPSFDGPAIGSALFGKVSIDRFQQAVYWAELAQQYAPPGLLPRESSGPTRLRRSGTTVRFPRSAAYPSFLLRSADLSIDADGDTPLAGAYSARVLDLSSAPSLVGRPTVFAARRTTEGSGLTSLRLVGALNHVGPVARDSVIASAAGVSLPAIDLPGLPFRVEPARGSAELRFVRQGDHVAARWSIRSNQVTWITDASRGPLSPMESIVERVVTGLHALEVTAELHGPIRAPQLSVRSNLDRAIGDRLRAIAGEEIARAERKVRAEVDRLVDERTAPVKAQVVAVQGEANRRLAEASARLDEERLRLEAQLKALGATSLPFRS